MSYNVTVIARDEVSEARWAAEIEAALRGLAEARVRGFSRSGGEAPGQVVFVDGTRAGLGAGLAPALAGLDRAGRAVILIVDEGRQLPPEYSEGRVDDVLVAPLRALDVASKLRHYHQILMWDEVSRLNESFQELMDKLHEDLRLAERLQKARLPARFPEVKGLKVGNRYLAGMRSGGDHFDLAETRDGNQLSLVLTDSSSYGLSSSVLSVLMRVAARLSGGETRDCAETVRRIQDEILATLGEKDRLSLFYGILSRKDYRLRYLNLGGAMAFYASPKASFRALQSHGDPIRRQGMVVAIEEASLALEPEGRLVLVSDGFVEAAGGTRGLVELLDAHRSGEAADTLNELVYRIKSGLAEPDDLPPQDCTAVILDIDSRLIRLA